MVKYIKIIFLNNVYFNFLCGRQRKAEKNMARVKRLPTPDVKHQLTHERL